MISMGQKYNKSLEFIKGDVWIIMLDILAVNAAYFLALIIRLSIQPNFYKSIDFYRADFFTFAPFYTVFCIVVFFVFRLYSGMWRYAGINDMDRIVCANMVTCIIHVTGMHLFVAQMPRTYYILGALFQFWLILCIRFAYRIIIVERRKITEKHEDALIVGGGEEAYMLHRILDSGLMYRPVCFVNEKSPGRTMDGLPVYKTLQEALATRNVSCVFIADLSLGTEEKDQIRTICEKNVLHIKDYTNFFVYSEESDAFSDMQSVVKGPSNGQHVIPFSPPDIGDAEISEVIETMRSGWITTGPRTKLLERRLAAYIETGRTDVDTEKDIERWNGRVACLNSATAAEELNLRILGIQPGDEVIVPAYTYTASASAVLHCGATVIFVDIQKDGDNKTHAPEMDYEKLEEAITQKTKAIVTVDLGGIVCDYDKVFEIVERKKDLFTPLEANGTPMGDFSSRIQRSIGRVAVIADCAHSLGASRRVGNQKKYCGAIADFTSFSFHAVKNLTTAEGGASTWRQIEGIENKEIYKYYQLLSLHGQSKDAFEKNKIGTWEYDIVGPWYKYNMTDIMAAIGLRQLDRYPEFLERRSEIIKQYDAVCDELGLLHLIHHLDDMNSSNHLYLVRVPGICAVKRNEIIEKLAKLGVATNVHYKPLPMMTAYRALGWDEKDFPNAYGYYENLFTLPLHTLLTNEDIEYVCEMLKVVMMDFA